MSDNIKEIAAEIRQMADRLGELQTALARIAAQTSELQETQFPTIEAEEVENDEAPLAGVSDEEERPESRQVGATNEGTIKLSLNDRYRFLRELFGNSNEMMSDVIGQLEGMTDAAEVTDFLLNRLGWDSESPVVADFIAAVCRRFDARPPLLS